MFNRFCLQFWRELAYPVIVAGLVLAFQPAMAGQVLSGQTTADQTTAGEGAGEILQDGLDALSDKQTDLARQLFEQLVSTFPGTDEATRAAHELKGLGPANSGAGQSSPNTEHLTALRRKLATDAGDRVFFAENSATIGGRARAMLDNQARWLKARPDLTITIIGRADDGGSPDEARALSEKRAGAVRDRLIEAGLPADKITVDARGDRDPLATCKSFMCQAQNRHAETSVAEPLRVDGADNGDGDDDDASDRAGLDREGPDRDGSSDARTSVSQARPGATAAR